MLSIFTTWVNCSALADLTKIRQMRERGREREREITQQEQEKDEEDEEEEMLLQKQ